jgi:hypothetical protein
MVDLAIDTQPNGEHTGRKFLIGLDARDNPTRSLWWQGTHKNISDRSDSNEEMKELANYILRKIKNNL